jgi:hypothetical protein
LRTKVSPISPRCGSVAVVLQTSLAVGSKAWPGVRAVLRGLPAADGLLGRPSS